MTIPYRPIILGLLVLGFSALVLGRAQAGGNHYFAPVANAVVKEECGSCHLPFAPSMLPASSWTRMMANLKDHFGDDASVDPKLAAEITAYLVANAGDQGGQRYGNQAATRRLRHQRTTAHHRTAQVGQRAPQGARLGVETQGRAHQGQLHGLPHPSRTRLLRRINRRTTP
jgi:hypothetical protein